MRSYICVCFFPYLFRYLYFSTFFSRCADFEVFLTDIEFLFFLSNDFELLFFSAINAAVVFRY